MDSHSVPRSRRSLLAAAAAAGGAIAARALTTAQPVAGANGDTVRVGQTRSGTRATVVRNTAADSSAVALKGIVTTTGAGGSTAGVSGQSDARNGTGVFGFATGPGANTRGVSGRAVDGKGVYGQATGTGSSAYGVFGVGRTGVRGQGVGTGVYGVASSWGVAGQGEVGVRGLGTEFGVYATGDIGVGVYAAGGTYGVDAFSGEGVGVRGVGTSHGVLGNGGTIGVYGNGTTWAGFFAGNVRITGVINPAAGSILIDHPADPANRTLQHSFVEAPERLNLYRGSVLLNRRGSATVRLPRYHEALNRDHHVQLTAVGAPAPGLHVARKVENGRFTIGGGAPGQEVYWNVTGVRNDAWAMKHPLRVDRLKRPEDRGRYLNPELFGRPRSAAIDVLPKVRRVPRHRMRPST